jgi:hypothetical protein
MEAWLESPATATPSMRAGPLFWQVSAQSSGTGVGPGLQLSSNSCGSAQAAFRVSQRSPTAMINGQHAAQFRDAAKVYSPAFGACCYRVGNE